MNTFRKSDIEVFVYKKKETILVCPQCRLEKKVDVEKIRDVGHWGVSATCGRCGHAFTVSFNFRKYYRKKTDLAASLYESFESGEPLLNVSVTDISLTGVGMAVPEHSMKAKALYVLRFRLDDANSTEIAKEILIESVRRDRAGASFVESKFDRMLNHYILQK